MRFSRLSFALAALGASASLSDDFYSVMDSAGDLLGSGKPAFESAVKQIMANPLVTQVLDDLNSSNRTFEAKEQLLDHVQLAMKGLFGTTNTSELLLEFTNSTSSKFDNKQVNQLVQKAQKLVGNDLEWVVPGLVDDPKLQNRTSEFKQVVQVIVKENNQHPIQANDQGFFNLVEKVSPEAIAKAAAEATSSAASSSTRSTHSSTTKAKISSTDAAFRNSTTTHKTSSVLTSHSLKPTLTPSPTPTVLTSTVAETSTPPPQTNGDHKMTPSLLTGGFAALLLLLC
ncbi:hypothetical protein CJU90_4597 [Yarrowia sp. C11]|nr:hypothetical protein CJU90_4597 [Yarrowia sp. C11]KAG5370539.1 hypothetical protein CKK34_0646 [Yarrowia sp. E02]